MIVIRRFIRSDFMRVVFAVRVLQCAVHLLSVEQNNPKSLCILRLRFQKSFLFDSCQ